MFSIHTEHTTQDTSTKPARLSRVAAPNTEPKVPIVGSVGSGKNTESTEHRDTEHYTSSLFSLVTGQLHIAGLDPSHIAAPVDIIEHQLTALVTDERARRTMYAGCVNAIVTHTEQGAGVTSDDILCSLTRRTRARLSVQLKNHRTACIRALGKLVMSVSKTHQLGLKKNLVQYETAFQEIERQLDAINAYLLNRLSLESTEHQGVKEPVNFLARRKAAALREESYIQTEGGLYRITEREGDEILTPIARFDVDVLAKRHIFTVPEHITKMPEPYGSVYVTKLAPLRNGKPQVLEIHLSDMLARQPQFMTKIQAVKLPHKRKHADFIDAIQTLGEVAPIESRYNATGIIRVDDMFVFLQPAGGSITPRGLNEQYSVQFPMNVASRITSIPYGWQRMSTPSERIGDYRTLLKILDIAPGSMGYGDVLLGTHAFAPMTQLCSTGGVWAIVHGLTGSMKSATSRLPLQGYAHGFCGRQETSTINLREGASTPYAIEQVLYYLSGMFAHLDDGLKGNNIPEKDIKTFYKLLSTIGGHAVTKQGAKRGVWGQGEGGFGIEPYPRGSGVYTVETLPASEGHASDLARYIVVSLDGTSCVDEQLLTELQTPDAAASMNRATCSYIQWLLPRMEEILQGLPDCEERYREHSIHSRTPTSYAKLETAIAALLRYGVSIGAHTEQDAARMLEESHTRLVHVALHQKNMMGIDEKTAQANDVTRVFSELLRKGFREHRLYASDTAYRDVKAFHSDGDVANITRRPQPPLCLSDESQDITDARPDVYGWRWNEAQNIYEPPMGAIEAGVLKIEGARLLLWMYVKDFKEVVYKEIDKLARAQDIPLPGLSEMISKLKEKGNLTSTHPTHLHGRKNQDGTMHSGQSCYIFDMTPEPEHTEPDTESTEHQDDEQYESIEID